MNPFKIVCTFSKLGNFDCPFDAMPHYLHLDNREFHHRQGKDWIEMLRIILRLISTFRDKCICEDGARREYTNISIAMTWYYHTQVRPRVFCVLYS